MRRVNTRYLLFVLCTKSAYVGAQVVTLPALPDLQVEAYDVKSGLKPVNGASAWAIDVSTTTVRAQTGETVKGMLRAQSIRPDGEALALVYQLNPQLNNADILHAGQELVIPKVLVDGSAGTNQPSVAAHGIAFAVTMAPSLRQSLEQHTAVVRMNGDAARNNASQMLGSAADRRAFIASLESIQGGLRTIGIAPIPLAGEALEQVTADAAAVAGLTSRVRDGGEPLSSSDGELVRVVKEDLEIKQVALKSGRNPMVEIEIRTRQALGFDDRMNLEVFVAPLADPRRRRPLATASSPAKDRIAEANYHVWAEDPGKGVVSEVKLILVRARADGKPFTADLILR